MEVVLLSSGMGEAIVGCLELPGKQRPGLAEGGSYMLWWKGSVRIASEWSRVAQEQGADDLVASEIPEPG